MPDYIPHNPQCFSNHMGVWAIHPEEGRALLSAIQTGVVVAAKHADEEGQSITSDYGDIRVINVDGMMMKAKSKYGGASTIEIRREIAKANRDEAVKGIALMIDSPGGHVAGMEALVEEVSGSRKPIRSYIQDLGASAAYWMASATQEISANRMAAVGSIGIYAVLEDYSQQLAMQGVKLHVVSSGGVKGTGADGTVTQELVSEVRKRVDFVNEIFGAAVRNGRRLSDADLASVHTGEVFNAPEALDRKLVDTLESAESFLSRFNADLNKAPNRTSAALAIAKRKV